MWPLGGLQDVCDLVGMHELDGDSHTAAKNLSKYTVRDHINACFYVLIYIEHRGLNVVSIVLLIKTKI